METWAIDLKQFNVASTCICPGFIDTPLTQQNKHPMPFIMSAEKGARLIKNAIDFRGAKLSINYKKTAAWI